MLEEAKLKINTEVNNAFTWVEHSRDDFNKMLTTEKDPRKFYQIFKVHKAHNPPDLPSGRPIISGCNSLRENISLFIEHHSKDLVPLIPSYIQDTSDFLRQLETLKELNLPEGALVVSLDVVGLYSNILTVEGLKCLENALNTRKDQKVPTKLLVEFMRLVLTLNIFEFDSKLIQQLRGTAMGTRPTPTFANIFMDKKLLHLGQKYINYYKRFINAIFLIWTGTEIQFREFMEEINKFHDTIKFTCSHEPQDKSTTFVVTKVSIINNRLVTDLYRKPTDRVQYLFPSSNHPNHIFKNVPYSLVLRLDRICCDKVMLRQILS
jgi:hypothetical protein